MMVSVMRTEIAIGREARSFSRWLRRAALPILLRWLVVIAIVLFSFSVFETVRPWTPADCEHWGEVYYSKSDLPAGHHYVDGPWGLVPCLDEP
jgi:hypothetical protein